MRVDGSFLTWLADLSDDQLRKWAFHDGEAFLHRYPMADEPDADKAFEAHKAQVLRPILDTLRALPPTSARQAVINDLVNLYFKPSMAMR